MPNPTILLVDADSLLWRANYLKKENPEDTGFNTDFEDVKFKFDETLMYMSNQIEEDYGEAFNIEHTMLFLEGRGNYRKWFSREYKIKRKDRPKPPLLEPLRKWVVDRYPTFVSYNVETDDSLVATYKEWYGKGYELIICSMDKDIRTVPCVIWDYYYTRNELIVVSEEEAMHNFWVMMLMGDAGDDVQGIKGIGDKKANSLFANCKSEFNYFCTTYKLYLKTYGIGKARYEFMKAYNLLRLQTKGVHTPSLDELIF